MAEEFVEQIKKMNKLLVLIFTKDMSQKDKILSLNKVGFKQKEIADFIGTTSNTVNVELNRSKKKKVKK
ncbi:MAG: hypothetical protein ABI543_10835 [Ignavibacteria bacterium]